MRRVTNLILPSIILLLISINAHAERASIVMDLDSSKVLHAKNVNLPSYPASLTKLMTVYLLLYDIERGKLSMQDQLVVSKNAQFQPPSRLGLKAGDFISVEETLNALIIKSANDAAIVAAEAVSGTEKKFVEKMNLIANFLGMKNTTFKNASGLPDPEQITTARDMVALGQAIYKRFPEYFHLFGKRSFTYKKHTYKTHNKFLVSYKGANGLKTGYTCHSGYNLASSIYIDGKKLIGVVLGENTKKARDSLMKEMMDAAQTVEKASSSALTLGEIRYYSDQGSRDIVNSTVLARGCGARKLTKKSTTKSSVKSTRQTYTLSSQ
jgi:D-alanyl-D-alanine carboxypeptidase